MAVLVVWLWKDVCIVNGEIPVGAVAAAMSDGKKNMQKFFKKYINNTCVQNTSKTILAA